MPIWQSRMSKANAAETPSSRYTVGIGDTLSSIARKTGTGVEAIARAGETGNICRVCHAVKANETYADRPERRVAAQGQSFALGLTVDARGNCISSYRHRNRCPLV